MDVSTNHAIKQTESNATHMKHFQKPKVDYLLSNLTLSVSHWK